IAAREVRPELDLDLRRSATAEIGHTEGRGGRTYRETNATAFHTCSYVTLVDSTKVHRMLRAVLIAILFVVVAACGSRQAEFRVRSARGTRTSGASVSVLGVYRDGALELDTWDEVGAGFGGGRCKGGFGEAFRAAKPDLAQSVDELARNEGVGDALF